ncbi:MAG: hypothetical protein RI953_290 [Pseudomonadota bacterium]
MKSGTRKILGEIAKLMLASLVVLNVSCSGVQKFASIFRQDKKSRTLQPSEADKPNVNPTQTQVQLPPIEIPEVTVGGLTLRASCLDLEENGKSPGTRAIHCTISAASQEWQVAFDRATLAATPSSSSVIASGVAGAPGTENSNWFLSSLSFVDFHFEVPEADYAIMKGKAVRLQFENLIVNGSFVAAQVTLEPMLKTYFVPHEGCGSPSESEQIVDLKFMNAGVSSSGSIFVPTTQPFDRTKVPDLSRFCGAELLDDLEFEWPLGKTIEHRVGVAINGRWYATTDLSAKETALQFSHPFFISRFFPGSGTLEEHLGRADSLAIGPRKSWCVFGREDCLTHQQANGTQGEKDLLRLTTWASKFVAVNHSLLLESTIDNLASLRIRFQNYPALDPSAAFISPNLKNDGLVRLRLRFVY